MSTQKEAKPAINGLYGTDVGGRVFVVNEAHFPENRWSLGGRPGIPGALQSGIHRHD